MKTLNFLFSAMHTYCMLDTHRPLAPVLIVRPYRVLQKREYSRILSTHTPPCTYTRHHDMPCTIMHLHTITVIITEIMSALMCDVI